MRKEITKFSVNVSVKTSRGYSASSSCSTPIGVINEIAPCMDESELSAAIQALRAFVQVGRKPESGHE